MVAAGGVVVGVQGGGVDPATDRVAVPVGWVELAAAVAVDVDQRRHRLESQQRQRVHRQHAQDRHHQQRLAQRFPGVEAVGSEGSGAHRAVVCQVHAAVERAGVHQPVQRVEQRVVQHQRQHHAQREPAGRRRVEAEVELGVLDQPGAEQDRVDQPEHQHRARRVADLAPQVGCPVIACWTGRIHRATPAAPRQAVKRQRHHQIACAVEQHAVQERHQDRAWQQRVEQGGWCHGDQHAGRRGVRAPIIARCPIGVEEKCPC